MQNLHAVKEAFEKMDSEDKDTVNTIIKAGLLALSYKNYKYNCYISFQDGEWFGMIASLPGCMSEGNSLQEVWDNLQDAKVAWLFTAAEMGREIPKEDY